MKKNTKRAMIVSGLTYVLAIRPMIFGIVNTAIGLCLGAVIGCIHLLIKKAKKKKEVVP